MLCVKLMRTAAHPALVPFPSLKSLCRSIMTMPARVWALSCLLFIAGGALSAEADPNHPIDPPVALVVDLPAGGLPSDFASGGQKRIDLAGFPVLIGPGATSAVGVAGNYRLELDPTFSVETHSSFSRMRIGSLLHRIQPGSEQGTSQATFHYSRDWLDLRMTPGLKAERPESGLHLGTTLDNRATLSAIKNWEIAAASHMGKQDAGMASGAAGTERSAEVDLTRRLALGSSIGIGYSYGWSSPESAAVSFDRQVAASANFAFASDIDCRAEYRQGVSDLQNQSLALAMNWDLMAQGYGATELTAGVDVQRSDAEPGADALSGAANLGLAMKF